MVLGNAELDVTRTVATRSIQQDISDSRCNEVDLVVRANIREVYLVDEQQVFQEESLHGRQNSARSTFILVDSVLYFVIEVESLAPGVVEVSGLTLEQQLLDSTSLLWCKATCLLRTK